MQPFYSRIFTILVLCFIIAGSGFGQDHYSIAKAFMQKNAKEYGLSSKQVNEPMLSSTHKSEDIGLSHFYFQQHIDGIPVHGAIFNIHVTKNNEVLTHGSTFVPNIESKMTASKPSLDASQALLGLFAQLGYSTKESLITKESKGGPTQEVVFDKGTVSMEDIPVKLVYQPMEDGSVHLAWDIQIDEPNGLHYWSIRVDAATGEILDKANWVIECNFGESTHTHRANSDEACEHDHTESPYAVQMFSKAKT